MKVWTEEIKINQNLAQQMQAFGQGLLKAVLNLHSVSWIIPWSSLSRLYSSLASYIDWLIICKNTTQDKVSTVSGNIIKGKVIKL